MNVYRFVGQQTTTRQNKTKSVKIIAKMLELNAVIAGFAHSAENVFVDFSASRDGRVFFLNRSKFQAV